ncbi:MAG: four helix bundle protein [bacterium]
MEVNNNPEKRNSNLNFEQRSKKYALDVIAVLRILPRDYIYQTLGKQLLRSATSVGANVVEAQAGSSKRDFTNFLSHALKSANESKFWISLTRDSVGESNIGAKLDNLYSETCELANILGASMLTLKKRR